MKYWVGVTDNGWFEYQKNHQFDEVNFWQPSATPPFKNAQQGMPFLFKLKKPNNHIAGGGFFVTYSTLPLATAWDMFGSKNGSDTFGQLTELINPLSGASNNNLIGCTILANPFYFPERDWIPTPDTFALNIVRGKRFDTEEESGESLWNAVREKLLLIKGERSIYQEVGNSFEKNKVGESLEKYGASYLVKPRLGQGSFRLLITEAYNGRCAITGESTLPVLEAAGYPLKAGQTGDVKATTVRELRCWQHKSSKLV